MLNRNVLRCKALEVLGHSKTMVVVVMFEMYKPGKGDSECWDSGIICTQLQLVVPIFPNTKSSFPDI